MKLWIAIGWLILIATEVLAWPKRERVSVTPYLNEPEPSWSKPSDDEGQNSASGPVTVTGPGLDEWVYQEPSSEEARLKKRPLEAKKWRKSPDHHVGKKVNQKDKALKPALNRSE